MAGNMIKSDDKPYHLYLSIEQFNQLMETIELMISIDDQSEVTKEMLELIAYKVFNEKKNGRI